MAGAYRFNWLGDAVALQASRATARGMIGIAERVVVGAQERAHVVTNTLRPSIHAAAADTEGLEDADVDNVLSNEGAIIEVGSWLDYACVEEVGRGHAFLAPAVEEVSGGVSQQVMWSAFRSEGLIA